MSENVVEFTCACGRKHRIRFGTDKAEPAVELDRPTYHALAWGGPVGPVFDARPVAPVAPTFIRPRN